MTLTEFLTYAAGPGINAIVGFILSFILEWWPDFEKINDPRIKRLVTMLLSFAIPTISTIVLWLINGFPASPETDIWHALQAGFLSFFAAQAAHIRKLKRVDIFD